VAAPARSNTAFGAIIANDWDAVAQLHAEAPIEALILHATAFEVANPDEMRAMFREGMVMAFINMYRPEIDPFLGLECPFEIPETWYPGNYFVTYNLKVAGSDAASVQTYTDLLLQCREDDEVVISGTVLASSGTANDNLDDWDGYYAMVGNLWLSVEAVRAQIEEQAKFDVQIIGQE
jgi:hypothetical protein